MYQMNKIFKFLKTVIGRLNTKFGKKIWLAVILILIIVLRLASSNGKPVKVLTAKVTKGELVESVSTSGKIKADQSATLTFLTPGKIVWLNAKSGDKVSQYQALASLDTVALNASYQMSLNNYRNAEAAVANTLDQVQGHSGNETYSQRAVRTAAEVARDNAYDALKAANDALNNAVLYAPFGGIVADVNQVIAGTNSIPGVSSITVVNPDSVYFEAEVEETDLPNVKIGQKVDVKLDAYPDEVYSGVVTNIGFVAFTSSTGGNAYKVKITMPKNTDMKFKVGMQGDADIIFGRVDNTLKVSSQTLIENGGKSYVWIYQNGKIKKTEVKAGAASSNDTEIKSGVNEGDILVESPLSNFKEGQKVSI